MATAFFNIQVALDGSLSTVAGVIPVAWQYPGAQGPYEPVTGTLYLRPTNLSGDTAQAGLGVSGLDETLGVYQVDIIAPLNATKKTILDLADDIADRFKRGSIHSYNGVNVRVRSASVGSITRDGAWMLLPVNISYFVFTQAR